MDKIPFFGLDPSANNFFNNLAFIFGIKDNNENVLKIPTQKGTGIIRKIEISAGIELVFFDFYLKHRILLRKVMAAPVEDKMLAAICILTPLSLGVVKKDQVEPVAHQNVPVILLTSAPNELDFIVFPEQRVEALIINFKVDSLQRECKDDDIPVHNNFKEFLHQKRHLYFKDNVWASIYTKLMELQDQLIRNQIDKLAIKSLSIRLLLDILEQVLTKYHQDEENNKLLYAKMEIVKGMLGEYLEAKLPSIPAIARKMAVSESTLKRNFKQVYGTSIYEYYLEIKMERAKELFAENPFSVKEVAYKLGYEKTSSFIKIFKKFYSFSPGELKKKGITV